MIFKPKHTPDIESKTTTFEVNGEKFAYPSLVQELTNLAELKTGTFIEKYKDIISVNLNGNNRSITIGNKLFGFEIILDLTEKSGDIELYGNVVVDLTIEQYANYVKQFIGSDFLFIKFTEEDWIMYTSLYHFLKNSKNKNVNKTVDFILRRGIKTTA